MKEFFTDATSATNFSQKAKAVPSRSIGTTIHTWVGKKLLRVRNAQRTIMTLTQRTIHLNYHASSMVIMFLGFYVFLASLHFLFWWCLSCCSNSTWALWNYFPHDSYDSYVSNEFWNHKTVLKTYGNRLARMMAHKMASQIRHKRTTLHGSSWMWQLMVGVGCGQRFPVQISITFPEFQRKTKHGIHCTCMPYVAD